MTKIQEINTQTQEVTTRDANKAELEMLKLHKENHAKELADAKAKATTKAALLERLGLTEDEAKLLLS
jgi:hypothetical protein